jgi:cytochrome b
MNRTLVWDLPLRLVHGLLAASIVGAGVLALGADDEGDLFRWHMLLGLCAGLLVVLRLLLALLGSRFARLHGLLVHPGELLNYLRGAFAGSAPRYLGHNPATAAATWAIIVLVIGLIATGVSMESEVSETLHAPLAYALLGVVALHLAGLLLHTLRYRENIAAAMVTGRKVGDPALGLRRHHAGWGLLLLLVIAAWAWALVRSYRPDTAAVRIPLTSIQVPLGEGEEDAGEDADD